MVTTVLISVKLGLVHITVHERGLEVGLAGIVLLCVCMCVFEYSPLRIGPNPSYFSAP